MHSVKNNHGCDCKISLKSNGFSLTLMRINVRANGDFCLSELVRKPPQLLLQHMSVLDFWKRYQPSCKLCSCLPRYQSLQSKVRDLNLTSRMIHLVIPKPNDLIFTIHSTFIALLWLLTIYYILFACIFYIPQGILE